MFLHVSGEALIEDGTDDGSRAKAQSLQGPACTDVLWSRIREFAGGLRHQWRPSIDVFAAACSARRDRFCSWTPKGGSEQVDAFAMRSWDSSLCPSCQQWHRECLFYFVLDGLADTVVRRARSDGARGLFLVPTNFKAGYFLVLRAVAVAALDLEAQQSRYRFTHKPVGRMTLFAADFGDDAADCWPATCAQAFIPRVGRRPSRGEAVADEAIQGKLRLISQQSWHVESPEGANPSEAVR